MRHPTALRLSVAAALGATLLLLAACSPVATLNRLTPSTGYQRTDGLAYGPAPRHRLDVYRPDAPAPAAGRPLVVFFYGGTWNTGDRADYRFLGEALVSAGIVVMVADYRLYPEVRYPDFLDDSGRAVAWALDHAAEHGADPRRVFVMGHSAGGYNAAMVALEARWLKTYRHAPSELAGWIGLAGPYDFLPSQNPDVQPVFHHPNYPKGALATDHVTAASPPAFIGAARSDSLVDPLRNSRQMADRLEAAGVPVRFRLYDRANHVTLAGAFARPLRWIAPVRDDVVDFVLQTPPK